MRPTFYDDFLGDVLTDQWGSAEGADDSTSAVAAVVAGAANGVCRITTGDGDTSTMAGSGVQVTSFLNWKANSGNLIFEARVALSAITSISVFVGLTDQVSSLEMPINSAGSSDTITTTATDAVGFFFDTAQVIDNWWIAGVKNDTDATHANTTIAPVAATYQVLRIELDASGNARFWIDGVFVGTVVSAVTATVALAPVIAAFNRTTSSRNVDIDYVLVQADRA